MHGRSHIAPRKRGSTWGWDQNQAKKFNSEANPGAELPRDLRHESLSNDSDSFSGYLPRHMDDKATRLRVGEAIGQGKLVALGAVSGVYSVEQVLQQWRRSIHEHKQRGVSDGMNKTADVPPRITKSYKNGRRRKTSAVTIKPLSRHESSYKLW